MAQIEISETAVTEQVEWLPNLLDHEIGHILSAWGSVLKVDQHLPPGHIMSEINRRQNRWTQEDIDLWCSASPCGRSKIDPSWTVPPAEVADSGHLLSFDGGLTDATGDAGPPEDGGS